MQPRPHQSRGIAPASYAVTAAGRRARFRRAPTLNPRNGSCLTTKPAIAMASAMASSVTRPSYPPKWGCDRGATKPEPKIDATLRATVLFGPDVVARSLQTPEGYARRSRLVWAKNPSPQTWSYLWNGVLSIVCWFSTVSHGKFDFEPSHLSAARPELIRFLPVRPKALPSQAGEVALSLNDSVDLEMRRATCPVRTAGSRPAGA